MAKFSFKRPRIISKKFPRVDSSIDSVTKSLNELVFSYSEQVDKSLQKKHVMMAISSLVLILVLGSFISPKGKAESSIFYPDTCLGGWVNPQYAQGEQETTSNGDESQFTKNNSAVLPKNTNAEMYCGNFKGKFDVTTKPTKIIVSLALTKGPDLLLEDRIESSSFSSSSLEILDAASSTDVSFTLASSTASNTLLHASSTDESTSSPTVSEGTATDMVTQGTSTDTSSTDVATGTPTVVTATLHSQDTTSSVVTGIIESFKDTVNTLFSSSVDTSAKTDTVVVPPPAPTPVPEVTPTPEPAPASAPADAPTSLLPTLKSTVLSALFQRVFAQTTDSTTTDIADPKPIDLVTAASTSEFVDGSSTLSTTTLEIVNNTSSSTLLGATTTEGEVASTTEDSNQFQNNFLEVLYTFDGVTWTSLGELNEISMKYRTFEIPVTASTTWSDMSHLQVKVVAQKHIDETPTVYLDAIKVEVLYETVMTHEHPDFARDTILKDEVVDGMRVLTIINNETKLQEVWYMHIDTTASTTGVGVTTSSTTDASSTPTLTASTTEGSGALTQQIVTQDASSTGTSTSMIPIPVIDPLLNKWKKYDGKDTTIATKTIVEEIKKQEAEALIDAQAVADTLPNFASDTVKRMKGAFLNMVIVQVQKGTSTDELWLYNATDGTQEKLGATASSSISVSSISVAPDTPLGLKDKYVFWLSLDKGTVYVYDLEGKTLAEQPLPAYDSTRGERAEMTFDGIPWKVIMNNEGFSFYSPATGEVFSDEDSRIVEALRQKMGLDAVLNKETLSNLSLPVSADPLPPTQ